MTGRRTLLATIAASLLVPSAALGATTYVVDPTGPVPCGTDHVCGTLAAAVTAVNAGSGSGDVIQVKPGVYHEAVAVTAASTTITRFPAASGTATITGGDAQNATISLRGQGPYTVSDLVIAPAGAKGNAVELRGLPTGPTAPTITQRLTLASDVLSGAGQNGYGLAASVNQGGSAEAVDVFHTTFADSGLADAISLNRIQIGSPALTVRIHNSIVLGAIRTFQTTSNGNVEEVDAALGPAPEEVNDDSSTSREALFVDPVSEDFHLLASAPNVLGSGGTAESGEPTIDIDGDPRPASGSWDKGADQFVNRVAPMAPTSIVADTATPTSDAPVGLTASGVTDADAGDRFRYRWSFGDGSAEVTTDGSSTTHSFAKGTYEVTVRAIDLAGHESPESTPFALVVSDPPPAPATTSGGDAAAPGTPAASTPAGHGADSSQPQIAIVAPRGGSRVRLTSLVRLRQGRRASRKRVRVPLTLRGTAATGGRVELALVRIDPNGGCLYYDGRRGLRGRACGRPAWFAAHGTNGSWWAAVPARVALPAGTYVLLARSGGAQTLVRFTIR